MKTALQAAGLILFGLAVAVCLLEVALRLASVGEPVSLAPNYDRPRANFFPHPDRQHPWISPDQAPLRVAVIGDSFTNAFGNQWADGYAQRLERLLNLNAGVTPAVVTTYARNGTTTWQQRAFLKQAVADGNELIILGLFINDTEEPGDPRVAEGLQRILPRTPTGWRLDLLRRSRALGWLYLRYERVRCYRAALEQQDYVLDPEYAGFQRFEQAIQTFARMTRQRRIRFVGVIWPSMGGLGGTYPHRIAHERMGAVLEQNGVPYLDLLDEFVDKSSNRLTVYPRVDNHPNEIGHRIGASAIFRFLVEEGHVDPAYAARKGRVAGPGYWLGKARRLLSPLHPVEKAK